jgi:hypothetical protein
VWAAAALGTFFLLLGSVFVGYAGVQTDEALFAGPLCRSWRFLLFKCGGLQRFRFMNMQYNGALKTWLYAPILLHDGYPNAALLRMPAIFMGAVTIVMFWGLLRRAHSYLAAWAGCILLVTDTSFLLMTTYDWGPVVLQHLLLVSAMYFGVRWYQTNATLSLANIWSLLWLGTLGQGRVRLDTCRRLRWVAGLEFADSLPFDQAQCGGPRLAPFS